MITFKQVCKQFYSLTALDQISLTIPPGEVVGLLGPNGAGKTTLLKLIAGLHAPSSGQIEAENGRWPAIGYKPERLHFPNRLQVRQYLELVAHIANVPPTAVKGVIDESLSQVGLLPNADKRIKDCSQGMRQRLGIAQALIGNPPLLLLDEPTSGLDPTGQREILACIRELAQGERTIILSSHQLQEVTEVCTQLIILSQGHVIYQNSMAAALALRPYTTIYVDKDLRPLSNFLRAIHPDIETDGTKLILRNEAIAMRRQILAILLNRDFDILRVDQKRRTLSEIYAEAVA